jgi:hypothetical protein
MARRKLDINIAGRVKKIRTTDFLVPLYEAVSNAIHAIEALKRTDGRITIELLRAPRQLQIANAKAAHDPITGFVVSDNGIGFTDDNMKSFCESDSTFKASIGGKGVGRFSWLKFFEKATIESTFRDVASLKRRSFTFTSSGVDEGDTVEVVGAELEPGTRVAIEPLNPSYEAKTAKSLDEVCIGMVEHFIAYLVTGSLPDVVVLDGAAKEHISSLYDRSIGRTASKHHFEIAGEHFDATGIKFFLSGRGHTAFLCGDKRVADKIALGARDPFFSHRFTDSDLRSYAFHMFVQSTYLDSMETTARKRGSATMASAGKRGFDPPASVET